MLPRVTRILLLAFAAVLVLSLVSTPASAQTGAIAGVVKDKDGKPLKDAQIVIERLDIKGTYRVKTKGKGDYFHAGLPLGTYKVSLMVDNKPADTANNVRVGLGDPREVNFNLAELVARQQELQRAAETGTLTQEQQRSMTPEQREAMEKQMKERSEALRKNKALNDAFTAGKTAFDAKQFDQAIEAFTKATELDPNQHVVWSNLAESHSASAKTKTGAEQQAALAKAIEAYQKTLALKPDEAGYHNNFGLVLLGAKKFDEAMAELEKAAQLDPPNAAMYYYNLGAILVNNGQLEPAGAAFKKAIEANPSHANAQYQYGIYLISKAQTTPDGKVIPPPGTKEAFQKYLELEPNGMFADGAKGMIATIDSSLQTEYANPDSKKKGGKKGK
jgi:tetratricopeptide (TPR) repeat protein